MKNEANYGGGKKGDMCEGMKTRSPPVDDKSRREIGSTMPNVDSNPNRSKPGEQAPTIGPRTA